MYLYVLYVLYVFIIYKMIFVYIDSYWNDI